MTRRAFRVLGVAAPLLVVALVASTGAVGCASEDAVVGEPLPLKAGRDGLRLGIVQYDVLVHGGTIDADAIDRHFAVVGRVTVGASEHTAEVSYLDEASGREAASILRADGSGEILLNGSRVASLVREAEGLRVIPEGDLSGDLYRRLAAAQSDIVHAADLLREDAPADGFDNSPTGVIVDAGSSDALRDLAAALSSAQQ